MEPQQYDGSFYLKSKNGTINFYDKLLQIRQKHGLSDTEFKNELHNSCNGILRLEFQCKNKYLQYLKARHHLEDTTLPYLWDAKIAKQEIFSRVEAIIGTRDFFTYSVCEKKLEQHYKRYTLSCCCQIIRLLRDNHHLSLHILKESSPPSTKGHFFAILRKIEEAGINPIPLEITGTSLITELTNPCHLIHDAIDESH